MKEARTHLKFCMRIYQYQLDRGKHFLHEHPLGASSWKEERAEVLAIDPRVDTTVGDLCQYEMRIDDKKGNTKAVKKPTRWMSSSKEMLARMSKGCPGDHEHADLLNGQAKFAAIWPNNLCVEILKGMRDTAVVRETNVEQLMDLELEASINSIIMDVSYRADFYDRCYDNPSRGLRGAKDGYRFPSFPPKGFSPALPGGTGRSERSTSMR